MWSQQWVATAWGPCLKVALDFRSITEFDKTGVFPKESATRSYRLDARRVFPMENIEEYCSKNNLKGGFFDNVDTVLDVLIN